MEKGKKVTRQYRIAEPIDCELNEISNATGKTKTAIIEEALLQYFESSKQNKYEEIANIFLEKLDEKYSAYRTRIRLGVRTAEINSQVMMEVLNTLLMLKGTQRSAFTSIQEAESPVISEAKHAVKEKIGKAAEKMSMPISCFLNQNFFQSRISRSLPEICSMMKTENTAGRKKRSWEKMVRSALAAGS